MCFGILALLLPVLASFFQILAVVDSQFTCGQQIGENGDHKIECIGPGGVSTGGDESPSPWFYIVGDIGGAENKLKPTDGQWAVAAGMRSLAEEHPPIFVLNMGDNFYSKEKGSKKAFRKIFEEVYISSSGSESQNPLRVPWYTIAGNKDYGKVEFGERMEKIKPQIKYTYSRDSSGYWKFPAQYYTVDYTLTGGPRSINIRFLMLDMVVMCGTSRKDFDDLGDWNDGSEYGEEHLRENDPPDEYLYPKIRASRKHMLWVESQLKDSYHFDYVIAIGHYPIYTTHPERSFRCANRLKKLFEKYKVSAYIAGHEHNLKHIQTEGNRSLVQIVSGAGSRMEPCMYKNHVSSDADREAIKFCYPRFEGDTFFDGGAFVAVKIGSESMEAKFYATGNYIYSEMEGEEMQTKFYPFDGQYLLEEGVEIKPRTWDEKNELSSMIFGH